MILVTREAIREQIQRNVRHPYPRTKPLLTKGVHRVVVIRVPATSTNACIHVTRDDESRKEHMDEPVLVYVSSDMDHRGNVNILNLSKYAVG